MQKNYEGSSGGMEAAAAVKLFGQSMENNLRYKVFISDRDSSAFDAVCKMNDGEGPYGDVKVEKGECINHVAKRLGTALRKLRDQVVTEKKTKTDKVRRMKDMGGRGKLTDNVIGKLQKYYGIAVRRHVGGTVEELRNDIYATFLHCSSWDAKPQHRLCPKTRDSWCFYQRAIANDEEPQSHSKMKVKFVLPAELRQKVWGEYRRLTSDKLLSACLLGKTQNQNEHLHSRVWRYCSKYKCPSKNILDFATAKAVIDYNAGYEEVNIQPHLGLQCTRIGKAALKKKDRKRESLCTPRQRTRHRKDCQDYAAVEF